MRGPARPPVTLDAALIALVSAAQAGDAAGVDALTDAVTVQLQEGLARGDLEAPRRVRDALQAAEPFIDQNLAPPGDALGQAAARLAELLHAAHLGVGAMDALATERAAQRPGATTRLVLQVLRGATGEALTRGEVHGRLPQDGRPSAARVSQILEDLVNQGLATRLRVAQGERVSGHYALSAAGEALCTQLALFPLLAEAARLASLRGSVTVKGRRYGPVEMAAEMPDALPWSMAVAS